MKPLRVPIAVVSILVLALLVPASAMADKGASGTAIAAKSKCSKIKNKKKRKKCKKQQASGQAGAQAAAGLAGSWTGTVSGGVSASLTFSVSAGDASVDNFAVTVLPVFCAVGGFQNKVFLIPSIPLSGGSFSNPDYQTTNDMGQVDGHFSASGTLSGTTGSGALRYERGGCSSGPLTWTATHA